MERIGEEAGGGLRDGEAVLGGGDLRNLCREILLPITDTGDAGAGLGGDLLRGLGADSPGHCDALLHVLDNLVMAVDRTADCLEGGCADIKCEVLRIVQRREWGGVGLGRAVGLGWGRRSWVEGGRGYGLEWGRGVGLGWGSGIGVGTSSPNLNLAEP